jgi:hypothetical protein
MKYHEIIENHIRSSVQGRGIHNVLHFTQIENLPHIITYGLMSYNECNKLKETVYGSDQDRFCEDSVSVTVESYYPKMFRGKQRKNGGTWIILALETRLLWELECNFYPRNIGMREMQFCQKRKNNGYAFDRMFEDLDPCGWIDGEGYREKLGLPANLTTFPDAEIQVMDTIPPEWITDVWIEDTANADAVQAELNRLPGPERDVLVQSFEPRFKYGGKCWG